MSEAYTKAQIRRRYIHLTWVVSGTLFAAGLGLSLSLMFLAAGLLLMMLAAVAALVGAASVAFMPRILTFVPVLCPFCHQENQVLARAQGFWCDSCGTYVKCGLDYGIAENR